jgi:CHAD domain-containing protein/transposase-like protein
MPDQLLTLEQRQQLEGITVHDHPLTVHNRARLLLLYDQGYPTREVAQVVGLSRGRVRAWRRQFQLHGMAIFAGRSAPAIGVASASPLEPVLIDDALGIIAGEVSFAGDSSNEEPLTDFNLVPEEEVAAESATGLISVTLKIKSPGVTPEDTLAEAGRKVLRYQFVQMLRHEEGTRLGKDIEELHDMRVATRRMRAGFEVFEAGFTQKALKTNLKGLRATGRTLGRARDLDVFIEKAHQYLTTLPEESRPGLQPLLQTWEQARETARSVLVSYLDSDPYLDFKRKFDEFVNTPGAGARPFAQNPPVPRLVRDVVPMLIYDRLASVRAFDTILDTASIQQFHALRIEIKKLRYTVEYFREVLGPEAGSVIDELKELQDHLGDLQDSQVATQILRDFLIEWDTQQAALPISERQSPEPIMAYLSSRYAERQRLMLSFREKWRLFNQPEFRQYLALAVAVL